MAAGLDPLPGRLNPDQCDGFVVQERVAVPVERHWVATGSGLSEVELFVDYSAFCSVGLEEQPPWGGVVRGSSSPIVNILGGGGVLPLLTTEVAEVLEGALAASGLTSPPR